MTTEGYYKIVEITEDQLKKVYKNMYPEIKGNAKQAQKLIDCNDKDDYGSFFSVMNVFGFHFEMYGNYTNSIDNKLIYKFKSIEMYALKNKVK